MITGTGSNSGSALDPTVNFCGLLCLKSEVPALLAHVRDIWRDELRDAIFAETGERRYSRKITWQNETTSCGTFRTASGRTGRYMFSKSFAPAPVVWLDS